MWHPWPSLTSSTLCIDFWLEPVLKSIFITSVSQVWRKGLKRDNCRASGTIMSAHFQFTCYFLNFFAEKQSAKLTRSQQRSNAAQTPVQSMQRWTSLRLLSTCLKYKHKHRIIHIHHRALEVTQLICWQALHVLSLSYSIIPSCPSLSLRCQELALNYIMLTLYLSGQFRVAHLCSAGKESIYSYNITSIWVEATEFNNSLLICYWFKQL